MHLDWGDNVFLIVFFSLFFLDFGLCFLLVFWLRFIPCKIDWAVSARSLKYFYVIKFSNLFILISLPSLLNDYKNYKFIIIIVIKCQRIIQAMMMMYKKGMSQDTFKCCKD